MTAAAATGSALQVIGHAHDEAVTRTQALHEVLSDAERVAREARSKAEAVLAGVAARLSSAHDALGLSTSRADGLASDLAAALAEAARLLSRLSLAEENHKEEVGRSAAVLQAARVTEGELTRAVREAEERGREEAIRADTLEKEKTEVERLLETLREEARLSEEARREATRIDSQKATALADAHRAELAESGRRGEELAASLVAERTDSESQAATLRITTGKELQRISEELEASRQAEAHASALSETMGRAAAAAKATTAEVERERDGARAELRAAVESSQALEGELRAEREAVARASERVAQLTGELKAAVDAAGKAAAAAAAGAVKEAEAKEEEKRALLSSTEDRVQVRRTRFCPGFFVFPCFFGALLCCLLYTSPSPRD